MQNCPGVWDFNCLMESRALSVGFISSLASAQPSTHGFRFIQSMPFEPILQLCGKEKSKQERKLGFKLSAMVLQFIWCSFLESKLLMSVHNNLSFHLGNKNEVSKFLWLRKIRGNMYSLKVSKSEKQIRKISEVICFEISWFVICSGTTFGLWFNYFCKHGTANTLFPKQTSSRSPSSLHPKVFLVIQLLTNSSVKMVCSIFLGVFL